MVCFLIVDTELNVGAGHTKRCLNLAEELRKHLEVSFIVTQVKSIYSKLISRSGFEVQALQKINKQKNSVCIVDGYNFSDEILNYLKENYGKLVYLNDREKFSQIYNIIISNFELKGKQSKRHALYGNTKYSLVRPLFKNKNIVTRKKIKNLFINFGMKDSFDFTLKTVFLLNKIKDSFSIKNVKIASNKSNSYKNNLKKLVLEFCDEIEIKEYEDEIYDIVKESDIIIGSGGVGLCERLCSGIPSLTIITAKNQELFLKSKNIEKSTLISGSYKIFHEKVFIKNFLELYKNFKLRQNMSSFGRNIIDGNGVKRVAKIILGLYENEKL